MRLVEYVNEGMWSKYLVRQIEKSIKDAAKDPEKHWKNAIELLLTAYRAHGVKQPSAADGDKYEQHLKILRYTVRQLEYFRSNAGSWRTTERLEESTNIKVPFEITFDGQKKVVHSTNVKDAKRELVIQLRQRGVICKTLAENEHSAQLTYKKPDGSPGSITIRPATSV